MVPKTLLEVRGLKKHFPAKKGLFFARRNGWVKAVNGIDFAVSEGQTLSLVGESGCGKTTVSKLVLRLEEPTEGSILFRGQDIGPLKGISLKQYRASVQAVFQDPYSSLTPRMRIGSFVAEPLEVNSILKEDERTERVKTVLRQVKLDPSVMRSYPHELSGGQRQRVALARALTLRPDLIVLDEPVSALDVSVAANVMNLLKDIQIESGVAYVLIAHNLATVRHLSHRIGVMYLGKLVESAPSERFFARPLHPYSQALLAAASPGSGVREMLQGEVPSPLNPPSGCSFRTRCPQAMPTCAQIEPILKEVESGHQVACHLY